MNWQTHEEQLSDTKKADWFVRRFPVGRRIALVTVVCVTIDTEGDCANNPNTTFFGIDIILQQIINCLSKYDIKATFFIQEDEICQVGSMFSDLWESLENDGHEIGYHAHGLIRASKEKKGYILTNGIQRLRKLGFKPISFRAGRYHLNSSLLKVLEKNEIRYDSSVVPGLRECFTDGTVRCDHIGAPHRLYYPSYEDHRKEGNSKILELPINRYPKLPSNDSGGVLIGGNKNEEILFDYFYSIRKDKLIIMELHTWGGLSLIKKFVRNETYKRFKRFTFESLKRSISPELLTNSAYFDRLDKILSYISRKKCVRFAPIKEAGRSIVQSEPDGTTTKFSPKQKEIRRLL